MERKKSNNKTWLALYTTALGSTMRLGCGRDAIKSTRQTFVRGQNMCFISYGIQTVLQMLILISKLSYTQAVLQFRITILCQNREITQQLKALVALIEGPGFDSKHCYNGAHLPVCHSSSRICDTLSWLLRELPVCSTHKHLKQLLVAQCDGAHLQFQHLGSESKRMTN